jgi:hypothetical protein
VILGVISAIIAFVLEGLGVENALREDVRMMRESNSL